MRCSSCGEKIPGRVVWMKCAECDGTGDCAYASGPCPTCFGDGGDYVYASVVERDGDAEEEAAVERRRMEREEEGRHA